MSQCSEEVVKFERYQSEMGVEKRGLGEVTRPKASKNRDWGVLRAVGLKNGEIHGK